MVDEERTRLREIRKLFHFGFFAGGGYGLAIENPENIDLPYLNGMTGPAFTLGAFIRKNFGYRIGYQLRLSFSFQLGSDVELGGVSGGETTGSAFAFETALEPTLKFGPMGQDFPLYIDLGARVGIYHVAASTDAPEGTATVSSTGPVVGAVGGLGFIFGSEEQFDLGGRLLTAAPVDGYFSIRGMFIFSVAIL